tara:strand:+ start:2571 stop:4289 length:1719 start_codon:yes stop_codon:yes gene_type:complete
MDYAAARKWVNTRPIFLVEITWGAYVYRFSTKAINLSDGSLNYAFLGGMDEPEIDFKLQKYGFDAEGDSIPFALVFPVDISEEISKGNEIEGSSVELSFVLEDLRTGETAQNYDDRFILFKGIVAAPIYGYPERPAGYVEFSAEEKLIIDSVSLLDTIVGTNGRMDNADISNDEYAASSPFTLIITDGIVDVADVHFGKRWPIILGFPGVSRSSITGSLSNLKATPVYAINYSNSVPDNLPMFLLIAGHAVEATSVKIWDSEGNSDTGTVGHFVGSKGNIFAYTIIEFASTTLKSAIVDEQIEYWATWDTGGGLPSVMEGGPIEGGADICLWCLSQVSRDIDWSAWGSVTPLLNKYKFAGYIIDDQIEPIQFLEENILPFLPIEITIGPQGLKPILNLPIAVDELLSMDTIIAGEDWSRDGPIVTETNYEDICNQLDLSYAKNCMKDSYTGTIRIVPDKVRAGRWTEFSNDFSQLSFRLFGRRQKSLSADYIYDVGTATKVARDYIKMYALPTRTATYNAPTRYGYLNLGDIITLSDSSIHLSSVKAQIIGKSWQRNHWSFQVELADNIILQ